MPEVWTYVNVPEATQACLFVKIEEAAALSHSSLTDIETVIDIPQRTPFSMF
jgi:hypothetical protein